MTTRVTNANFTDGTIESGSIKLNTLTNADFSASAAIAKSKFNLSGSITDSDITSAAGIPVTKCNGVAAESEVDTVFYSIASQVFKRAQTDGISKQSLKDGFVDEYEDENGVSSSTGMTYNSTDDYYNNASGGTGAIISNSVTATSAPSKFRVCLFQEDVGTPTANTDFIVSVSRDGGSTYTTATLTDGGYYTGTSGMKIWVAKTSFTSTSGSSVVYKIDCANQESKIHGISVQWA